MITLTRTVRFSINHKSLRQSADIGGVPASPTARRDVNGYAGVPGMRGFGRYYEIDVVCRGEPDPASGYFKDIKELDRAVRRVAIPAIEQACDEDETQSPVPVMAGWFAALDRELNHSLDSVHWRLTPTYGLTMHATNLNAVRVRQRFELAAAHRLHVDALSAEANRALFGRCNNPSGHGHNYVVEPELEISLDATRDGRFDLAAFERAVDEVIMRPFDHMNLNIDTPEFDTRRGGVNPSVENIAQVFFDKLAPAVSAMMNGWGTLRSVTVFETEKTRATYPG
ncbi:MAG: 6-carboxytetrahydropterin synthase [Phycisphaerales bacterium]|nr:6-carboxytetrahydropterin synthase [Phycisphaerales bacterium]